jgi:hypothetical protein
VDNRSAFIGLPHSVKPGSIIPPRNPSVKPALYSIWRAESQAYFAVVGERLSALAIILSRDTLMLCFWWIITAQVYISEPEA